MLYIYLVFVKKFISANTLLKQFIDDKSGECCRLSFPDSLYVLSQVSARELHKQRSDLTCKCYAYRALDLSVKTASLMAEISFWRLYCAE